MRGDRQNHTRSPCRPVTRRTLSLEQLNHFKLPLKTLEIAFQRPCKYKQNAKQYYVHRLKWLGYSIYHRVTPMQSGLNLIIYGIYICTSHVD